MAKQCPHCGKSQFKAKVIRPAAIKFEEDGSITILKELPKFAVEVIECLGCKAELTNDNLVVPQVPCTQCQTPTEPDQLVNGLCPVCNALASRPDLANASQTDLVRRLLELESQLKAKQGPKVEAKVEKAAETVQAAQDKADAVQAQADASGEQEPTPAQLRAQKAAETRKANAAAKAAEKAAAAANQTADAAPAQTPEADKAPEVESDFDPMAFMNEEVASAPVQNPDPSATNVIVDAAPEIDPANVEPPILGDDDNPF